MKTAVLLVPLLFLAACATSPREVSRAALATSPVAVAPSNAPVWPANAPGLAAQSAVMIDARSGEVLFQKNADAPRVPASTQKLLTALLVSRRGNLDAVVTIKPEDTASNRPASDSDPASVTRGGIFCSPFW